MPPARSASALASLSRASSRQKAEAAKHDCAISKALSSVQDINLDAKLVEHAG
jgi:hypothetical protein